MAAPSLDTEVARKCHRTLEAYHGFVYFAPRARDEYAALGLPSELSFMGYFASRAAAMGAVPGEVVLATFFNFHPELVLAAAPACWEVASPRAWVDARLRAVDASLQEVLGAAIDGPEVREAVGLARAAADACDPAGRPLFAGHASLIWPDQPHVALWHAITLLREYRGDGHISILVEASIAPCEALVLHEATGQLPRGVLQSTRAWPDDEWAAARQGLEDRGWIDGDALTAEGVTARNELERRTDELAMAPWNELGHEGCQRLRELVRPMSKAIIESGALAGGLSL
jgi:hypothetical protein